LRFRPRRNSACCAWRLGYRFDLADFIFPQ